jgi:putative transposase
MPDYRRAHVPGGTYFFTINTYRRQTFLTDVDVRSALREAIGTLRLTHPFVIEAWVLLPDHMHALWTLPPGDEDFSYRWRVIKRMVTQRCQTRLNRPEWMNARRRKRNQSTLWQHRFWEHLIRDEADFNRHIDYIHWNPVKHGYVAQVGNGRIRASIGMSNRWRRPRHTSWTTCFPRSWYGIGSCPCFDNPH